jgi:hypothetical protein
LWITTIELRGVAASRKVRVAARGEVAATHVGLSANTRASHPGATYVSTCGVRAHARSTAMVLLLRQDRGRDHERKRKRRRSQNT